MADTHIIKMLDETPFGGLRDSDIARCESHIAACEQCKAAYEAARLASSLIQARTSETVNAGPFFKARVLAAIRERRLAPEEPVLLRMWRAAGAMVSTMVLLLAVLTGITIFTQNPDSQWQTAIAAASENLYSPEYVVLERGDRDDDELANDQVLGTMYDLEDGDGQ